ncbi:MAG: sugar transferase [Sphingomonadaceae bacterium]
MAKRTLDIALALALLPFALPVLLVAALAVRLDSPGPAFFRQERVGKDRQRFRLLKIRTMTEGTKQAASHEVGAAQVTRVGAILRRSKIDELPQIFAVLAGKMSFVGPRPCLPLQEELVAERERRGVYAVLPGITGPAQVAGVDMSTPVELAEIDARYVRERTLLGDLRLILLTAIGGGSGDAARQDR